MTRIDIPAHGHHAEGRVTFDPDSPINDLLRGQKVGHAARRGARIASKVAKVLPPPDAPDIAELRAQAESDREAAASAQRRADAAKRRVS